MKKFLLLLLVASTIFISCQNPVDELSNPEINIDLTDQTTFAKVNSKPCFSKEALDKNLVSDPDLANRMSVIEEHSQKIIKEGNFRRLENGSIVIPVVFHVIYRTASENVSLSTLQDQIDILNEDFNLQNPERNTIPSEFSSVEANVGITFEIQDVIRVYNRRRSWSLNNAYEKMKSASSGGSNVVNPSEYLNIWVVNNMTYRDRGSTFTVLGYAQFPGGASNTDGVVLGSRYTGYTSISSGRTATHEVGHYLNLYHIWGDGGCGATDLVADTPDAISESRGCPTYPQNSCGSNDMTMNFMDYSDDSCLNMFTVGQKARMDALFVNGGARASMGD